MSVDSLQVAISKLVIEHLPKFSEGECIPEEIAELTIALARAFGGMQALVGVNRGMPGIEAVLEKFLEESTRFMLQAIKDGLKDEGAH